MKNFIIGLLFTFLGCGFCHRPRMNVSCSVTRKVNGALIECPNSETFIYDGEPGQSITGPKGDAGPAGISCTETVVTANNVPNDPGQYGGAIITCGTQTVFIKNGSNGQSITGPMGPQGLPGLAGTQVSQVKFCSGYTTTYPSVFPEYGLCFGGHLFAVYWDHTNAWLAEVVPGYYASTSTSAPCNFTVLSNCQIQ